MGDVLPETDGTARLPDLQLAPGTYTIRLGGPVDGQAPYILRATYDDRQGADPEPNDDAARALTLEPGRLMAGRLARTSDQDSYRLSVDAALGSVLLDARLIVRSGPARRLCLLRLPGPGAADTTPRELSCDDGEDVASLPGLLLQPAEYLLAVTGVASPEDPYYLRVDTSVAPLPGFETEPNDTPDLATAMTPEASLSGRLDDPDHVRVHIDGAPQLWQVEARGPDVRLLWERTDGVGLGTGTDPDGSGGRSVLTDVYLIPGDHWFRLDGTGEYTLELVPLGPPVPGGELESNDELSVAESLPMDGSMTGRIGSAADQDVFAFPLATTEHVGVRLEPPPGASLWLYPDGDTAAIVPTPETPTPGEAIDLDLVLPAGNHAVRIVGAPTQERYRISLSRLDPYAIPGDQEAGAAALPLEMDLVTATPEVAAFESLGQHVSADLSLTNRGAEALDLSLDGTTSEPDWTVDFETTEVSIAPGASTKVPVTIEVPAQAWSGHPARATVRARGTEGQATTFIEITPRATAPLVAPVRSWTIPDELLGGLDAAASGLGAIPLVAVDPVAEAALHDGVDRPRRRHGPPGHPAADAERGPRRRGPGARGRDDPGPVRRCRRGRGHPQGLRAGTLGGWRDLPDRAHRPAVRGARGAGLRPPGTGPGAVRAASCPLGPARLGSPCARGVEGRGQPGLAAGHAAAGPRRTSARRAHRLARPAAIKPPVIRGHARRGDHAPRLGRVRPRVDRPRRPGCWGSRMAERRR